jgi:hypothetical protein
VPYKDSAVTTQALQPVAADLTVDAKKKGSSAVAGEPALFPFGTHSIFPIFISDARSS